MKLNKLHDDEHPPILGFKGEFRWMSNFWPAKVKLDGVNYPTTEHAYQAAKTTDPDTRAEIAAVPADKAGKTKRLGKKIQNNPDLLRPDWDNIKVSVMEDLLRQKFKDPILKKFLLDTDEAHIEETNTWGDTFWGVCKGKGENNLGKLLMQIRNELHS